MYVLYYVYLYTASVYCLHILSLPTSSLYTSVYYTVLPPLHVFLQVSEDEVLDVVERVLQSPQSSQITREYAINAVMKLSIRWVCTRSFLPFLSLLLFFPSLSTSFTSLIPPFLLPPLVSPYLPTLLSLFLCPPLLHSSTPPLLPSSPPPLQILQYSSSYQDPGE